MGIRGDPRLYSFFFLIFPFVTEERYPSVLQDMYNQKHISPLNSIRLGDARVYTPIRPILTCTMSLDEAVDEALATYGMSRSEEAEETGRLVASLQD